MVATTPLVMTGGWLMAKSVTPKSYEFLAVSKSHLEVLGAWGGHRAHVMTSGFPSPFAVSRSHGQQRFHDLPFDGDFPEKAHQAGNQQPGDAF